MFWACVCSLNYPAIKAHALYYIVVWGRARPRVGVHIISYTARFSKKKKKKKKLIKKKIGFFK